MYQDIKASMDTTQLPPMESHRLQTLDQTPPHRINASSAADKPAMSSATRQVPNLPPPAMVASTSPCMVKSDLREFITGKRTALDAVLAQNPDRAAAKLAERKPYRWPQRSLAQQVGGSVTDVSKGNELSKGQKRQCAQPAPAPPPIQPE